jgi:hypothetical protein
MKLPADFEKTLAEKPAEELCEMLANAEDYLPEAIQAAQAELGRRELPQANVASMVQSATAQRVAEETEYRDGPLDMRIRILILIVGLWMGVGCFLFYRSKGCRKKARQSLVWILYHFGLVFGLLVLSFILYSLGRGR